MLLKETEQEYQKTVTSTTKVLVADDDLPTRMLLRAAIEQWGYDVIEAADGEEAWQILDNEKPPVLLIIDWLMPKMDGLELCEKIRKQLTFSPYVILLTQLNGASNVLRAIEAGADEFLTKPFNMTELKSRLSVGNKIINYKDALAKKDQEIKQYLENVESSAEKRANSIIKNTEYSLILSQILKEITKEITVKVNQLSYNQAGMDKNPDIAQVIEKLNKNLEHVVNIIKTLYSEPEALTNDNKINSCQINNIINESIGLFYYKLKAVKLECFLDNNLPVVNNSTEEILQILTGLLINQTVLMARLENPSLLIKSNFDKESNKISLIIKSSGVRKTEFNIAYKRFWVLDNELDNEVNLSIAMIQAMVATLSGDIKIVTDEENGIEFIVELPVK